MLIGLYNEAVFGTAFHTTEQVYLSSSTPFGEFSTPIYEGLYLNLFSPLRGLFVYSIFLVLGVFGLAGMLRERLHREEAALMLACFLGILLPYSAWYDPVGGAAFGPRFLVAAVPFLLVPAGLVIEEGTRNTRMVAFILYAVGVVISGIAGVTEGIAPTINWGLSPLLSFTLPNFLRGELDDWWVKFVGQYWPIPAVLLIATAVALPIVSNRLLSRDEKEGDVAGPPQAGESGGASTVVAYLRARSEVTHRLDAAAPLALVLAPSPRVVPPCVHYELVLRPHHALLAVPVLDQLGLPAKCSSSYLKHLSSGIVAMSDLGLLGVGVFLAGVLVLILATVLSSRPRERSERAGEGDGEKTGVKGGSVVMIGPIPIIFGTDAKWTVIAILLAIVLIVLSILLSGGLR